MNVDQQERLSTKRAKEVVLRAMEEFPVVVVACKKAGIAKATYYRWMREDIDFARKIEKARREGVEFINDLSESQLISLIKDKRHPSIKYWLDNHHADYARRARAKKPSATGLIELIHKLEADDVDEEDE